ncbi:Transcription factor IIIB 90 kDa subunit [Zootermopsis nevadensis]|uniref:Transcription factor IIIB 90 kDa subunit n=1 Tax=Zootermopsis nevadensis TaxID=136037 RepID=A0A067R5Y8_ZOONE|nr:Transcription factor IIIB 90 kDa subunit [Zootermopsis nevadensis]
MVGRCYIMAVATGKNFVPLRALQALGVSGGIAPLFLDLGTRWGTPKGRSRRGFCLGYSVATSVHTHGKQDTFAKSHVDRNCFAGSPMRVWCSLISIFYQFLLRICRSQIKERVCLNYGSNIKEKRFFDTYKCRLIEFGETPSSSLTLDEFMTVDLEEEQDPPSFKAARKKDRERLQKSNEGMIPYKMIASKIFPNYHFWIIVIVIIPSRIT